MALTKWSTVQDPVKVSIGDRIEISNFFLARNSWAICVKERIEGHEPLLIHFDGNQVVAQSLPEVVNGRQFRVNNSMDKRKAPVDTTYHMAELAANALNTMGYGFFSCGFFETKNRHFVNQCRYGIDVPLDDDEDDGQAPPGTA